jgi:hypothetical protein
MSSATQIAHLDALLSRARNRVKAIATMGSSFLTEFVGALEPRLSRTRRFSRRCGRCGRCGPRVMRPARGVGKAARCFLARAAFAASFLACRKENSEHLDMLQRGHSTGGAMWQAIVPNGLSEHLSHSSLAPLDPLIGDS